MRYQHDRQDDPSHHVAQDHLNEGDVASVGHRRNADNRQSAGFGGYDRKPNAPPWDIAAAQKIVARAVLLSAETEPEPDDPDQIGQNDHPITHAEVAVHAP